MGRNDYDGNSIIYSERIRAVYRVQSVYRGTAFISYLITSIAVQMAI